MKILIPYDGSKNTEIALSVLRRRADFALEEHDALIVVSGIWLPESPEEFSRAAAGRRRRTVLLGISSPVEYVRGTQGKQKSLSAAA